MIKALQDDDRLTDDFSFIIPFVAEALKANSKERPSANELLSHPFLTPLFQETVSVVHMADEDIILGGREGSVHVIDANQFKRRHMVEQQRCHTDVKCITSCGPVFAVAGEGGSISLWKTETENDKSELLKTFDCHNKKMVWCIKMNETILVSSGDDRNIVIHRRSQSNNVESQLKSTRPSLTQTANVAQNGEEDLEQSGVIKLSFFSRPQQMVLSKDQLFFIDLHHLKHYSLSISREPQQVTQMEFKDELFCLTASSEDMPATDATMRGDTSHPRYFWVGTHVPVKIMKVDLVKKVVLAEVEVWKQGFIRQIETFGQYLLCRLQETKTNYTSCLCFALSDLPRAGVTPRSRHDHQPPVPFRQFVQFGKITSDICCRHDSGHVFYYFRGEFHHLSVKQLEAIPKQTSLTLHPEFEE